MVYLLKMVIFHGELLVITRPGNSIVFPKATGALRVGGALSKVTGGAGCRTPEAGPEEMWSGAFS